MVSLESWIRIYSFEVRARFNDQTIPPDRIGL